MTPNVHYSDRIVLGVGPVAKAEESDNDVYGVDRSKEENTGRDNREDDWWDGDLEGHHS